MNVKPIRFIVAVVGLSVAFHLPASAQDNFFKGKTIRVIVGLAPGGGFDTYSRVIARHFGKHIPGNPALLVDTLRIAFVSTLRAVTRAPSTTAPELSVTVPWIEPLCACAIAANNATSTLAARILNIRMTPPPTVSRTDPVQQGARASKKLSSEIALVEGRVRKT